MLVCDAGTKVIGAHSLQEMVNKLKKPRRVMMLVKAGSAVDSFIDQLLPLLEKGDVIIDGGNSEYTDSIVCCCFYKSRQLSTSLPLTSPFSLLSSTLLFPPTHPSPPSLLTSHSSFLH